MNIPDSPAGLSGDPARNNCSQCGRERTPADDNHHPACSYWHFFGDPGKPCPCWKCTGQPDPRENAK